MTSALEVSFWASRETELRAKARIDIHLQDRDTAVPRTTLFHQMYQKWAKSVTLKQSEQFFSLSQQRAEGHFCQLQCLSLVAMNDRDDGVSDFMGV